MAKRLATEYVKTCLQLTETEMVQWLEMFGQHQMVPRIKVLDNGSQEIAFLDECTGKDVVITFERTSDRYVMTGGFRVENAILAELLRKAIVRYRGDAEMHRIYSSFTMEYHYAKGAVDKIIERTEHGSRLIYERKVAVHTLQELYSRQDVEREIRRIRETIDRLLDSRLASFDAVERRGIDDELSRMSRLLFVMEA